MKQNTIKAIILVLLMVASGVALSLWALQALRGRGEYTLSVSSERTVVVNRTDNNAHSGPFNLHANIQPGRYTLGSEDDSKGIYTITFFDTTRRPGHFTLSIGNSTLDIMEARIIFDQKEVTWQK